MVKHHIKHLIETRVSKDGLTETGISGIKLFRASAPIPCAPAVYEPCVIAIVSGSKDIVLDGARYIYDSRQYLCCPMPIPLQAGAPETCPDTPLCGVFISLDQRVMTELTMEMDRLEQVSPPMDTSPHMSGIRFADWDDAFGDALLRALQLDNNAADSAILRDARLRELYYAILKGDLGAFARQAFRTGNAIARSIAYVSSHLDTPISIHDLAMHAGMSRAVYHRKFKQITTMSPIQFVKSMRLSTAATDIAAGMAVNEAALKVGYVSTSQFSREFKRLYGQSRRQWGDAHHPRSVMS